MPSQPNDAPQEENASREPVQMLDSEGIGKFISSLADQILQEYSVSESIPFLLVGIHRNGVPLANRIAGEIEKRTGRKPEVGTLDITMYRDDIGLRKTLPDIRETVLPDIDGADVILVDDILQSGRTIRAALDAITYFGRPGKVRLAALLDRGKREFPIRPDYLGKNVTVPEDRRIVAAWKEFTGREDTVLLTPKKRFA
ncbi:MAG: bifunctional pyr operon transcriptional regulator/uracil phosphoribosyltransferase PyrR [Lentisphaeria bacterium]|nr:bifunctional pyr operon transcriptional regulator/uracil phosphoribosyltransferase PyrR [Lentisphaeria bacterium]